MLKGVQDGAFSPAATPARERSIVDQMVERVDAIVEPAGPAKRPAP